MIYPVDLQLHSGVRRHGQPRRPGSACRRNASIRVIADRPRQRARHRRRHCGRPRVRRARPAGAGVQHAASAAWPPRHQHPGLGIRHRDPVHDLLERVIDNRVEQKVRQIENCRATGSTFRWMKCLRAQGVPGQVHIAQVAFERNRIASSTGDVFTQYLASDAQHSTLSAAPSA